MNVYAVYGVDCAYEWIGAWSYLLMISNGSRFFFYG